MSLQIWATKIQEQVFGANTGIERVPRVHLQGLWRGGFA